MVVIVGELLEESVTARTTTVGRPGQVADRRTGGGSEELVVEMVQDRGAHTLGTLALIDTVMVVERTTFVSLVIKMRLVLTSEGSVADSMRNFSPSNSNSSISVYSPRRAWSPCFAGNIVRLHDGVPS